MPIRVLVVHNAYQHRGGEDTVVEAEVALLRSRGHDVQEYRRDNAEIARRSRVGVVAETFWSGRTTSDIAEIVHRARPDIIHVHNTFPLVSPSLYWAASRAGVPIVQTLHNFRLFCPQAMFLRDGKVCEDCLGRLPFNGIRHGCYRESRAQTAVLASMLMFHRTIGTYANKVSRYIALNDFCRRKFIEGGLPADRIVTKPNFVDFDLPQTFERSGFLFVGRLSQEKGIATLANAFSEVNDATLRVAGTGPEVDQLQGRDGIALLGGLSGDQVREEMSRSSALVLPSIWYENFPRTLVEAFGCALPVIASRLGALAELVEDGKTGLLFEPGNAKDLAKKMRWANENPDRMAEMGANARRVYEENYTADRNYAALMEIYNGVLA